MNPRGVQGPASQEHLTPKLAYWEHGQVCPFRPVNESRSQNLLCEEI